MPFSICIYPKKSRFIAVEMGNLKRISILLSKWKHRSKVLCTLKNGLGRYYTMHGPKKKDRKNNCEWEKLLAASANKPL